MFLFAPIFSLCNQKVALRVRSYDTALFRHWTNRASTCLNCSQHAKKKTYRQIFCKFTGSNGPNAPGVAVLSRCQLSVANLRLSVRVNWYGSLIDVSRAVSKVKLSCVLYIEFNVWTELPNPTQIAFVMSLERINIYRIIILARPE